MVRKYASGSATKTATLLAMTASDPANAGSLFVADTTGYTTDGYFVICIDRDTAGVLEEKLLVSFDGNTDGEFVLHPTLGRGFDDTTPKTHAAGAPVEHVLDADSVQEMSAHIYDTTRDDHTQYVNSARHDTLHSARRGITVCTSVTRPSSPVSGDFIFETDTGRTLTYIASVWRELAKPWAQSRRIAGNITSSASTAWQSVDTGMDLLVPAVAGDVIEVSIIGCYSNEGTISYLDVATIVSGNPVNYFICSGGGSDTPAAWQGLASVSDGISGTVSRKLVSGDISGAYVTLRLRLRNGVAIARVLQATATNPLIFTARNIGPDI